MKIKDRLSLLQILPSQGSICEMVDAYDLARELKLSDEEKGDVNYIESGVNIKWDYKKDPDKEINISSDQYKLIMKEIDKLDQNKQIPLSMIELILYLKDYGKRFEVDSSYS